MKGGNYSREETIRENMVSSEYRNGQGSQGRRNTLSIDCFISTEQNELIKNNSFSKWRVGCLKQANFGKKNSKLAVRLLDERGF